MQLARGRTTKPQSQVIERRATTTLHATTRPTTTQSTSWVPVVPIGERELGGVHHGFQAELHQLWGRGQELAHDRGVDRNHQAAVVVLVGLERHVPDVVSVRRRLPVRGLQQGVASKRSGLRGAVQA